MKVLMLNTGKIQEVAEGYARNFLFPRKLAKPATGSVIAEAHAKQALVAEQETKLHGQLQQLAEKLTSLKLPIAAQANATGTLFAAVSAETISQHIKQAISIDINTDYITISEPIKHLGDHVVKIVFPNQTPVDIHVQISRLNSK